MGKSKPERGLSKVPPKERNSIKKEFQFLIEELRERRNELDLTQEELAEKLDLSDKLIKNYEQGRTYPSFPTFLRLLKALKLELSLKPQK